jgi:hypothetical protein
MTKKNRKNLKKVNNEHLKTPTPSSIPNHERPEVKPEIPITPDPNPSEGKKSKTEHCRPDQTPRQKYALEGFAIAVALAVAWIYGGQLSVMKGQLGVLQDTIALERPWIGPSGFGARVWGPRGERLDSREQIDWTTNKLVGMTTNIQNGGHTPATKVRWHMLFKLGRTYDASDETVSFGLPTDEVCDKGEMGPEYGAGTIMGGVTTQLPIWIPKDILQDMSSVFATQKGLYAVGCIDYSDASGKPWYRTNMRFVFTPNDTVAFSATRFGNETK